MTQWFEVTNPFHAAADCLFINQPALLESRFQAEALQKQGFQHLSLHLSGEADADVLPVTYRLELGKLLTELSELCKENNRILP